MDYIRRLDRRIQSWYNNLDWASLMVFWCLAIDMVYVILLSYGYRSLGERGTQHGVSDIHYDCRNYISCFSMGVR